MATQDATTVTFDLTGSTQIIFSYLDTTYRTGDKFQVTLDKYQTLQVRIHNNSVNELYSKHCSAHNYNFTDLFDRFRSHGMTVVTYPAVTWLAINRYSSNQEPEKAQFGIMLPETIWLMYCHPSSSSVLDIWSHHFHKGKLVISLK